MQGSPADEVVVDAAATTPTPQNYGAAAPLEVAQTSVFSAFGKGKEYRQNELQQMQC